MSLSLSARRSVESRTASCGPCLKPTTLQAAYVGPKKGRRGGGCIAQVKALASQAEDDIDEKLCIEYWRPLSSSTGACRDTIIRRFRRRTIDIQTSV